MLEPSRAPKPSTAVESLVPEMTRIATERKNVHSAAEGGKTDAESIGDTSIGLVGRDVLNRFGRLGQSVEPL